MVTAGGSDGGDSHGRGGSEAGDTVGVGRDDLRLAPMLTGLDHATTLIETPVRRLAGSARLNPLPHAGTMSVFLLGVVVVSGLYITLFFEYGHAASYESVAAMEAHAIQRVVRALHRYSSAALVITTIVHGWRILSARRFIGRQRRFRWATGVSAVVLVWLAGVTGYWLVWDVRAQALNEVLIGFIGGTGAGTGFAVDHLGVLGGRSGSGFLLLLWFVHLLLTVAIGYFVYRHLRRTNLPWLPPQHMMAIMGGALVVASLALPVGMLAPAQPDRLIDRIPVDPFVLFLLPPLLSEARWLVAGAALILLPGALLLPRLLQRRDPAPVVIDDQACTGCELCVIDCPYQALTLNATGNATGNAGDGNPLAVVDERRCVGCGICLGSCAFGAIELPGFDPAPPLEVADRPLVIACDRHAVSGDSSPAAGPSIDGAADDAAIHLVSCAGAVAPETFRLFAERGATDIQVIGCPPNDCRYGIGNTLAAERLTGERRPHPAPKYATVVAQDWVPGDRVRQAVQAPGSHPSADGRQTPRKREALIGAGLIAAATATGAALATRTPFDAAAGDDIDAPVTDLRVVIDHREGRSLASAPDLGPVGPLSGLEFTIDDRVVATIDHPDDDGDGRWAAIIDVSSEIGGGTVVVNGLTGRGAAPAVSEPLTTQPLSVDPGTRTLIDLTDTPPRQTVEDGRRIFASRAGGCDVCHSVEPGDDGVGPSLAGVASVAGDRVDGLSAEQYFRQSILLPDQFIVDGWPAGQMLPIYRDRLSPEELDAVIDYLLTLEQTPARKTPDEESPERDSGGES